MDPADPHQNHPQSVAHHSASVSCQQQSSTMQQPERSTIKEPPTVIYSDDCHEQMAKLFSVCQNMLPPQSSSSSSSLSSSQNAIHHSHLQAPQQHPSTSSPSTSLHHVPPYRPNHYHHHHHVHRVGQYMPIQSRPKVQVVGNSSYVQTLQEPLNRPPRNIGSSHSKTLSLPCQPSSYSAFYQQLPEPDRQLPSSTQPLEPFHTLRNNAGNKPPNSNPVEQAKWTAHMNEIQRMEDERMAMLNRQNGLIQAGLYNPNMNTNNDNNNNNINFFQSNLSEHCEHSSFDSGLDSNDLSLSSQLDPYYPSIFDTNNNNLLDNFQHRQQYQLASDYLTNYQHHQQQQQQQQQHQQTLLSNDSNTKNLYVGTNFPNNDNNVATDYLQTCFDECNLISSEPFIHNTSAGEYFGVDNLPIIDSTTGVTTATPPTLLTQDNNQVPPFLSSSSSSLSSPCSENVTVTAESTISIEASTNSITNKATVAATDPPPPPPSSSSSLSSSSVNITWLASGGVSQQSHHLLTGSNNFITPTTMPNSRNCTVPETTVTTFTNEAL